MKSIIATFLLVLFSTIQVMDLHILSHDSDDAKDCIVCITSNDTHPDDYFIPLANYFEVKNPPPCSNIIYGAFPILLDSFSAYSFLNKAPPTYLFS